MWPYPFKALVTIRYFSSKSNTHSFTVSYLINSCGLSSQSAKRVSKYVNFENSERPDAVINLLKDYGLTKYQISQVIRGQPKLILFDPVKTILPKIQFLRSIGVSDLPVMISKNPVFLSGSLNNLLIPVYGLIKSLLFSDEKVLIILKRISAFNMCYVKEHLPVNLSVLRELGMRQSTISILITNCPNAVCANSERFSEAIKNVVGMGFDPRNISFANALRMIMQMKSKTWKQKIDAFSRLGFSEEEIWSVIKKRPLCMGYSEKTIIKKIDFLVNKMGWQPAIIAKYPVVLCYSFEKRVVPRCSVVRVLILKGLIKPDISLKYILQSSEKNFLDMFVIKYQEQVPELSDVLLGKIDIVELGLSLMKNLGDSFVKHTAV
ncbi:transcription termination factor MTERF15, mitochondrial [Jatropha curcas]|uniref:transcription termination factor MTERF15, mitochondrial n=1 Tax=Jatropha curcas TaxID=180498 RepID=UPI001894FA53|nr:transcription termination factor MTERF15, mitochondrial [Jatropha curcas]